MHEAMQAWGAPGLGFAMTASHQTVHSSYTTAVFIDPDLAAACGLADGGQYALKKNAELEMSAAPRMPVYRHHHVPPGHICMATSTMHQLALPEHSQVRAVPSLVPSFLCRSSTTHAAQAACVVLSFVQGGVRS